MTIPGKIWVFFDIKSKQQFEPMTLAEAQTFLLQLSPHEFKNYVGWTPGWEKWVTIPALLKRAPEFFPAPPSLATKHDLTLTGVAPKTTRKTTGHRGDLTQTQSRIRQKTVTNSRIANLSEHTYTEVALHNGHHAPPSFKDSDFQPDVVNWDKTPVAPILARKSDSSLPDNERRQYKRFPHRIEIVLMTRKGKSFRSSSQNISLGGVQLREPVPADLLRDVMDIVVVNPFPNDTTPSHLLIKGRIVGDTKDQRRLMFYDISPESQSKLLYILENYKKNYIEYKKTKKSA